MYNIARVIKAYSKVYILSPMCIAQRMCYTKNNEKNKNHDEPNKFLNPIDRVLLQYSKARDRMTFTGDQILTAHQRGAVCLLVVTVH